MPGAMSPSGATPRTLREWLAEAPFALAMSSGFFSFFAHTGVLQALEEEGFLPRRVSGSSAGALVTGAWASGLDARNLARELIALRREHFWDPAPGFGLLRGRLFADKLLAMLPVRRFSECRVPAAVSVFDVLSRTTRVIDEGELAPALQASCSVPFLFQPVWRGGRPLLDGGILDRPGLLGMPEGERVLFHHIVSRSPWRARGSEALEVPRRQGMITLKLLSLPRSGPFRLDAGRRALDVARDAARRALDLQIREDGVVES